MTFLGMKLKVTQNRRRKERVCRMLPFPLCITVRRLVTIPTAWGNFAHAHIVITNWLILVCRPRFRPRFQLALSLRFDLVSALASILVFRPRSHTLSPLS